MGRSMVNRTPFSFLGVGCKPQLKPSWFEVNQRRQGRISEEIAARKRDLLGGATDLKTRLVNTKSQVKCVAINEIHRKWTFLNSRLTVQLLLGDRPSAKQ